MDGSVNDVQIRISSRQIFTGMKTEFEVYELRNGKKETCGTLSIIGTQPDFKPYVSMKTTSNLSFMRDQDLERFAVNILKALKSKRLKK
jgi:hypothetical protein